MSELPAPHTWKAPAHDSFCRQQHWEGGDCFDCRLIAKVRADERDVSEALADLRAKARLRAQVQPLYDEAYRLSAWNDLDVGQLTAYRKVLALLDGSNNDQG